MTNAAGATTVSGLFDTTSHSVVAGTTYDALGDPLAFTVFPDTGNPQTSQKPLSMQLVWDAAQNVTDAYLPGGQHLVNTYNNGQKTRVQLYSPSGQLLSQNDFAFDSIGRVYRISDLVGTVSQYRYDQSGNVTRVLDGKGNSTTATLGNANEVTSVSGADGGDALYNADGSVRQTTDRRGVVTTYTYDNTTRLTQSAVTGSTGSPTTTTTYSYDDADRVLSINRGADSIVFAYDHPNKWPTGVTTTVGGRTHIVLYTYRADGRRSTMVSKVGTLTRTTLYDYDNAGRLNKITHPNNAITQWTFDYIGRPLTETTTSPTGTIFLTTYIYGSTGQAGDTSTLPIYLRQVTRKVNGTTVASFTLTHSYLGQLLTLQRTIGTVTSTKNYSYDLRGRLVAESRSVTSGGVTYTGTSSYSYDLADNLNAGTNGWLYNSDNRLTSAPTVGGMPGASNLQYDAAGNCIRRNNQTLTYNLDGQLSGVTPTTGNGISISIEYDPLGRRYRESVTDISGTTTTRYFDYDGDDLIGEQSGGTVSNATYGSYLGTPGGYVGSTGGTSGQDQYYHYGPDGEMWGLAAQSGSSLWLLRNNTDAYGNVVEGAGTTAPPAPFLHSGGYTDNATGWTSPADGGLTGDYDANQGDLLDNLDSSPSYGAFLARSGKNGWANLKKLPSWQPGSPERQFESDTLKSIWGIGQIYTLYGVVTGRDPVAGRCLSTAQRIRDGVMLGVSASIHLSAGSGGGMPLGGRRRPGVTLYQIGRYKDLKAAELAGDDLEIHHLPQGQPAEQIIPGYVYDEGIAIALPTRLHRNLPTTSRIRGVYTGNVRQLIGMQLRDLYKAGVPRDVIKGLFDTIRSTYPGDHWTAK